LKNKITKLFQRGKIKELGRNNKKEYKWDCQKKVLFDIFANFEHYVLL